MIGDFRTFASYSVRERERQHAQYLEGQLKDLQPSRDYLNGWRFLNAADRQRWHEQFIRDCERQKTLQVSDFTSKIASP